MPDSIFSASEARRTGDRFVVLGLAAVVLAVHGMAWPLDALSNLGTFAVGALTAVSGGQYIWR